MALLRIIGGPDTGTAVPVDETPVTIGRGDDCTLKITDKHVSIIHALVEPFEAGYRVRDLETTGGTAVNGTRILERRLLFGDVITIGETAILFGTGGESVDAETVHSAESPLPGTSSDSGRPTNAE